MYIRKTGTLGTLFSATALSLSIAHAAPPNPPPAATRDVNVVNTPLDVTVTNPTSIPTTLDVNVINTAPIPVDDGKRTPVTTSGRGVILSGESATSVDLQRPDCPEGTKFLITGIQVGPEISVGATRTNVVQLGSWAASVFTAQRIESVTAAVPLNVLGTGPQHLSTSIPAGQLAGGSGAFVTIALLGGVTAPVRFEFNVHVTGFCGVPFVPVLGSP